jgi:hypothetical protein
MRPIGISALTRLEYIGDVPFAANTAAQINRLGGNLPLEKYLWGLILTVRGRATMPASGGPSALSADGPYSIVDTIVVEGYHRGRAQLEHFIDLPGADAYRTGLWFGEGALPELPSSWSFSANATNDFEFHIILPFVPARVSPLEQMNYLLDAPNYESLRLTLRWADAASMFGSYTNAPALSAFGSATGSPVCEVHGVFAVAGASRFAGITMGKVWRQYQRVTGSPMTTTANNVRLLDLPKGYYIRSLVLKCGVLSTTVSSGNTAYASLNDNINEINIMRGLNNTVRYFKRPSIQRAQWSIFRDQVPPVGYTIIDFALTSLLGESFNARDLVAGPSGSVDFYIQANVTGVANQALTVLIDEVRQLPVVAGRPRR